MTPKTKDVVLLCNPRAGGRWRALADVLDSPEARIARRIVTDEIDDLRQAIQAMLRLETRELPVVILTRSAG